MPDRTETSATSQLCYLDASKVKSPAGVLSELDLLTSEGEPFGSIEGVVIEAAARRVRYFDVRASGGWRCRRYLLPADQLAHFDADRKALRLRENSAIHEAEDVDTTALRDFSDEDFIAAMFSSQVA